MLAALLLLMAVVWATGPVAARAQDAPPGDDPALAEFEAAFAQWKEFNGTLRDFQRRFAASNREGKQRLLDTGDALSEEGLDITARLLAATETAITIAPDNPRVRQLVGIFATACKDADRYEDCLRLCRLLISTGKARSEVYAVAIDSAVESGRLDVAEKLFQQAQENQGLESLTASVLRNAIDTWRSKLDREIALDERGLPPRLRPRVLLATTRGDIVIELYEDQVPNTVANFIRLVDSGFYNNLSFFRVVSGFGAIAGCPNDDGTGNAGFEIDNEQRPSTQRQHVRGAVSMISTPRETAGSQFFITLKPSQCVRLDDRQTVFGRVVEGMDVVSRLRRVDPKSTTEGTRPDRIIEARVIHSPRRTPDQYLVITNRELVPQWIDAGKKLVEEKKLDEAIAIFQNAMRLDPNDARLPFLIGLARSRQDRIDDAIVHYRQALKINPDYAGAHYALGALLVQKRLLREAQEHFAEALRVTPDYQPARDAYNKVTAALEAAERGR